MDSYSDTVLDQYKRPVAGALVYIFTYSGAVATLTDLGGTAQSNPMRTDQFGGYSFKTEAGRYRREIRRDGQLLQSADIIVGTPPELIGPPGPAGNVAATLDQLRSAPLSNGTMLAAYDRSGSTMTWTEGNFVAQAASSPADYVQSNFAPLTTGAWVRLRAENIPAAGNLTVQQSLDQKASSGRLISLASPKQVTQTTSLATGDLNTRIICMDGATNYTVNLPMVSAGDEGKAVFVVIDRGNTRLVTLQSAAGSGVLVDGVSLRDMIAGESALYIYDGGAGWRRHDYVSNPIRAMLTSSANTALTIDSFTSVPVPSAGRQLMEQSLSALWNPTGGYFTAPRAGTYTFDIGLWLVVTGGPARVDIGGYVGSNPGGVPGDADFYRAMSDAADYQRRVVALTFSMNKGERFFPAVRVQAPATAASVSNGAVASTITVTEQPR